MIEMIYSSGKQKFKWQFSVHEIGAMEILASKGLKDVIDDILGVDDFGDESSVGKKKLTNSVDFLINEIRRNSGFLPYLYSIKLEIPKGSGNYSSGGHSISGLKIDSDKYDCEYGLGKCVLKKIFQDEDLTLHYGEPVDIRHLTKIETDSDSFLGDLEITKKKIGKKLLKSLEGLKNFLSECSGDEIVKVLG